MTTPLKPGDAVVGPCDPVGNLPPKQLALRNGVLVEIPGTGVTARGKLFLASRKAAIIANFAAQGLTICDDATHHFAKLETCLRLNLGPAGKPGLYVWGTNGVDDSLIALRLRFDGTPDPGFGPAGRVTLTAASLGGTGPGPTAVCGQSDGSLIASGFVSTTGDEIHFLVRLLATGALDPAFGTGGVVTLPTIGPGGDSFPSGISVVPAGGGKISNSYVDPSIGFGQVRQHIRDAAGNLLSDVPADDDPVVGLGYPYYAVIVLAGGGWAAVGINTGSSSPPGWIVLWDATGAFVAEIALPSDTAPFSGCVAMAALPDGKFLLTVNNTSGEATVRRYAVGGGSVDWISPIGSGLDGGNSVAGLASGSSGVILTGQLNQVTGELFLGQFLADGGVNTSFGIGGIITSLVDLTDISLNVGFGQGLALSMP